MTLPLIELKRRHLLIGLSGAAAAFAAPAHAQAPLSSLGAILMHGKGGTSRRSQGMQDLASKLESAGAKAVVPDMPWSQGAWERISQTVTQCHEVIDGYVAQLRSRGAQRIVIGGESIGANVALSYAVARQNVAGLVMTAPGHAPQSFYRAFKDIREAVDKAKALVDAGQGDQAFRGADNNQGNPFQISTTARVYLSWFSPRGPGSMPAQAPLLPASIPLIVVIGKRDVAFSHTEGSLYKPAAKHPYSRYLVVEADHATTAFAASQRVFDWIKGLPT